MFQKYKQIFIILLLLTVFLSGAIYLGKNIIINNVYAGELEDLEKQLSDLKRALEMSVAATTPLEKNLDKLNDNLNKIKDRIDLIEKDVENKEKEVNEGETLLVFAQELLSEKVRKFYKHYYSTPQLLYILTGKNLTDSFRNLSYQKAVIGNDRDTIVKVVLYIKDLEEKKKNLELEKVQLSKVKTETDAQAAILDKEITGAKKYQSQLSSKIAQLSDRQKQLLAEKLSSLNLPTSLGAGPLYCTDDRKIDPGFGNAFAFFTFGIPHRVGMNQYGAYGRAKAGQDYKSILNAYFKNVRMECKSTNNKKIKVAGHGEMELEKYLLGIYEIPESWPMESLKAQVVAARSYAIAYTGGGEREICTTQSCQVYKGGNKGGQWEQAVNQTGKDACSDGNGQVLVSNDTGEVITAWYASTSGGYTFESSDVGWNGRPWTKRLRDTTGDVNSFSDLFDKAYDKESPCFYSAQGFRNEFNKSAWLKNEEVADIVNVLLLAKKDSSVQSHLSQKDKPNPDGTDTWDEGRVKLELRNRGVTPYNSISSVSVDWDKGFGRTNTVTINGDAGSNSFDGNEFKNFFNLRAPANIQIVGPLYNVERR